MKPQKATYTQAMAAGRDAANRRMRKAGRSKWNEADWNEAVRVFEKLYGKKPNPSMFGPEAVAAAKRVKRIRPVKERSTGERGHIIGAGPAGWLKVKWANRDKPTLIKRSELKLARGLRSLKNPIEIRRCTSCGQVFGQSTECPMCHAGIGIKRNPKARTQATYEIIGGGVNNKGWWVYHLRNTKTGKIVEASRKRVGQLTRENRIVAAKRNGITEAAAGLQALEYLGGKVKKAKLGPKPKFNPKRYGKMFYVYAQVKPEVSGNHDPFLVASGIFRSKTSALAEAKRVYREQYNPQYLKDLEWKVLEYRIRNPRAKGSRDPLGVWHKENPRVQIIQHRGFTIERRGREFNVLLDGVLWNTFDSLKKAKHAIALYRLPPRTGDSGYLYQRITRKQKNPSVTALSETFQGEADGSIEKSYAANGAPSNLARAGRLVFLKVAGTHAPKGAPVITLRIPGATVAIASNEKLWIVGDHAPLFETKARSGEGLDVGEVTHICYETAKAHIGNGKTYEYVHEFGEDGGKRPHLIIDHEGMPLLRGGDYKIRAEGIVD